MTVNHPATAPGTTVWLTGLPSAGKTTIAHALAERLRADGRPVEVLDGDAVREHLTADLGFSRADRDTNVRRVGFVAHLLSRNGVIAVCSLISPYRAAREEIRALHDGRYFEVFVDTPSEVCAERDVKGLYAKQRRGEISGLTGVDDPYEAPEHPDVVVPTTRTSVAEAADMVLDALRRAGRL